MQRSTRAMGILIALTLALAACGASDSSDFSDPTAEVSVDGIVEPMTADLGRSAVAASEAPAEEAPAEAPADEARAPDDPLGSGGTEPVSLTPADIGRDIIFTANITTAVTDVIGAGEEATRIIQGLGGIVFGQHTTANPNPSTVLTFKVFPKDFQTALDRLGSIGELRDQTVSADDVTERVVDIRSRIATAEASVQRLRGFLENATDTQTIADLEGQLLERETALETLRGQLRTIEDQVALATIVLNIVQANARPEVGLVVTGYAGYEDAGAGCPGQNPLQIDEGEPATLCFEITNVGDTALADLAVTDTILDRDLDDLVVVFGDPSAILEPGDSVLLATEIVPERDIRTRTTVTATPLDEDGTPINTRSATVTGSIVIDTVVPEGIPTFTDGLERSWDLLVRFVQYLFLAAGMLLPFIWVVPLVWWLRRRDRLAPATDRMRATDLAPPPAAPDHAEEDDQDPASEEAPTATSS